MPRGSVLAAGLFRDLQNKTESVAVGTALASRPPHRSGRAELPHPAPALGHDADTLLGIHVTDVSGRNPAPFERRNPFPGDVGSLASPAQCLSPEPDQPIPEPLYRPDVEGHRVVLHVPRHDRAQVGPESRNRIMEASPQDS